MSKRRKLIRRNPMARALKSRLFQARVVKSVKVYDRKRNRGYWND